MKFLSCVIIVCSCVLIGTCVGTAVDEYAARAVP